MKKPRIFISMHYMEIGGAEAALIGLLHALDPQRVDVDLFLHAHRGELMSQIPSWVRILPELRGYSVIESPMREALRKGCAGVAYGRWKAKKKLEKYVRKNNPIDWSAQFGYIGKYVSPWLPSLKRFGRYDLAVSFLAPHDYVLRKVDAERRACWIHTDYSRIDIDTELELPVWDGYDNIVSISPDVTETFCQRFPSLRKKITEIENIAPIGIIRKGGAAGRPADMPKSNRIQLLTIGRICYPKKLDEIPAICRHITDCGIDVEWFIIGYGASEATILDNIKKKGMEGRVHLLGKRDNPYPYIAACDWYVQPSRYEGKSVVVREAQMLGKPVIVTAYPTAASQIADGMDGVIVPMPAKACADAMAKVISDNSLRARLCENIAGRDYSNASEVEKFYKLAGA